MHLKEISYKELLIRMHLFVAPDDHPPIEFEIGQNRLSGASRFKKNGNVIFQNPAIGGSAGAQP